MELLSAIFIFAIATSVTPGPNNIMMMTSGLNYGVKKSMPHLFGICVGFPAMVMVVGLGLGFIFERYAFIHELIKVVGILYLLYLAWAIAQSTPMGLEGKASKPISFIQGALFQWVNPKAWITATSAIAAYTSSAADVYLQVGIIAAVFFLVAFPCVGAWVVFGARLKQLLQKPAHQSVFNRVMSLLLVLSVLPAIVELISHYGV